jgi:hypothetical protein
MVPTPTKFTCRDNWGRFHLEAVFLFVAAQLRAKVMTLRSVISAGGKCIHQVFTLNADALFKSRTGIAAPRAIAQEEHECIFLLE